MPPITLTVPHIVQREQGDCLAACAAMMLLYLKHTINYDLLVNLLGIRTSIGAPVSNIRRLETLNVSVNYRQGILSDLEQNLLNNQPSLTPVQTGELPYWTEDTYHAVVVIGLDDHYVYVNDPAMVTSPIQVPRGDFDLAWLARDEMYAVISSA